MRSYTDRPIETEKQDELREFMNDYNRAADLHMQLVVDDPTAFDSRLAHYGKFAGVRNYFAMIGPNDSDLDERLGYWGERLVLQAQQLGLNTCWVGLTFKKNLAVLRVNKGEKVCAVVALGYGTTQGVAHKVKPFEAVTRYQCSTPPAGNGHEFPEWFRLGVEDALLAPTAMNQQKFRFTLLDDNRVKAEAGWGFFTKMDLGIAKYHFEVGAGMDNFEWV